MRIDLTSKKMFYATVAIFYGAFASAVLGIQLYLNYSMKSSMSEIIAANSRGHLIVRSMRRLEELTLHHIETLRTFDSVTIKSKVILGDQVLAYGKTDSSIFWNQCIVQRTYFNGNISPPLADFTFCYRSFEGIPSAVIACFIVIILTFPLVRRYRHSLQMSLIRDKEADIGRITRQISHDLRGPLGAFERLLFLPPGTSIDEHKFVIRQALARFNHMIESLRNMDEEFTIDSIPCNLDFEIGMYALGAKALKLGKVLQPIAITLTEKVIVDPIKFERAWVNLATNAIDAAESMVCIEFLNEDFDLIVRVKDDGPGVSDEFLPKLFQRGSTYGKADGTGLGLAYVRQIMRGHGGDVTYRRENDLTIFECRLPHAVVWEEAQVMENTLSLDTQLVQNMVRTVAICLEPDSLSRSVLSQLASYKSDDFLFSEERETANIVVSNIDEIMFSVLEGDEQEFIHVSPLWGNEGAIVERLVRKFNLNGEK